MKTKHSPLTDLALRAIHDLKALDVKLLDVREQTPMTDAMIVCTGTSSRHVRSIAENVVREAKRAGQPPQGVEGMNGSEWVLVDLGGVVVHVMQAQTRVFYQLEKLWEMAPVAEIRPSKVARASKPAAPKKAAARKGAGKTPSKGGAKQGAHKPTRKPAKKPQRKPARTPLGKAPRKAPRKPARKPVWKGKPKRRA